MLLNEVFRRDRTFKSLSSINGLSVQEIERRAARIDDNKSDKLARFRSFEGFLAPSEPLATLLARDWRSVVVELQSSHEELAQHVVALLVQVESARTNAGRGAMATVNVDFDTRKQPLCSKLLKCDKPVSLVVSRKVYAGDQYSLFANPDAHTSIANGSIDDEQHWRDEYAIECVALGFSLLIGGCVSPSGTAVGVPSYIARYGFYEGGDTNPYRVAPVLLASLLCGRALPGALTELERRHAALLARFDEQLRAIDGEIGALSSDDDDDDGGGGGTCGTALSPDLAKKDADLRAAKREWLQHERKTCERDRAAAVTTHAEIVGKIDKNNASRRLK